MAETETGEPEPGAIQRTRNNLYENRGGFPAKPGPYAIVSNRSGEGWPTRGPDSAANPAPAAVTGDVAQIATSKKKALSDLKAASAYGRRQLWYVCCAG